MTYTELVAQVAKDAKLPRTKVARVLGSFIKVTRKAVLSGAQVRLRRFGTFHALDPKTMMVFGQEVVVNRRIRFRERRHGEVQRRAR